jgi:RNA polymerase sigma-70 factor (ECF subfamily)
MIAVGAQELESTAAAGEALAELCRDYWPPIYAFIRRRGFNSHDAQDLTQAFFAYLIESKAYMRADREAGKFRTFLLVVLKRFLSDVYEREHRLKRGGDRQFIFLDRDVAAAEALYESGAMTVKDGNEERLFDWDWAEALVARAMKALRAEYAIGAKSDIFGELQAFLTGGQRLPKQEEVATRLNVPIETLRSHLSRLRARYREILRGEIGRTVATEEEVDAELKYLCEMLISRA